MTKPLIPADLLKSVTSAKPQEGRDGHATSSKGKEAHPRAGITPKVSTKPAKTTQSHTRTSNRGK